MIQISRLEKEVGQLKFAKVKAVLTNHTPAMMRTSFKVNHLPNKIIAQ